MVNSHKTNWHHMVFSTLWAYYIVVKASQGLHPSNSYMVQKQCFPSSVRSPLCTWTIKFQLRLHLLKKGWYSQTLSMNTNDNPFRILKPTKRGSRHHSIATIPLRHSSRGSQSFAMMSHMIYQDLESLKLVGRAHTSSIISSSRGHTYYQSPMRLT